MSVLRATLILGTRPEAIKLAPVALAMRARPESWECALVGTGQQRDLVPEALGAFGLACDRDLGLMSSDQQPGALAGRLLSALDALFSGQPPDWVVVQGDTTSAMAGALAAFYRLVPVAHVEAGLRTDDRRAPFPEEAHRRIVAVVADLHLAPTEAARARLRAEGADVARIAVVGNTAVDALRLVREPRSGGSSRLPQSIEARLGRGPLILVTGHRRESFGGGLAGVCQALLELADRRPDLLVVYPVHLNPTVVGTARSFLGGHDRIVLCDPLPYAAFVELMERADLILTDSGGVQEEAPSLGKRLLVTRERTERTEGVAAGVARLVGTEPRRIVDEVLRALDAPAPPATHLYGDGHAAERILDALAVRRTRS